MNLRELLDQTNLDMTEAQVKAFLLGVLCAERPMPFPKVQDELLLEAPEAKAALEGELLKLWDSLRANLPASLQAMLPTHESDLTTFMEISKEQLDYFLTAMSLSGTNADSCDNEELAELIEELEDTVAEMDDFLAEASEEGMDLKNHLLGIWEEFTASK